MCSYELNKTKSECMEIINKYADANYDIYDDKIGE